MATINWNCLGFPSGNWDERKIWAIALPSEEMHIREFLWLFKIPYWESDNEEEFIIRPWDVIYRRPGSTKQWIRTQKADLSFPIDVLYYKGNWIVLDGVHRLVKAYLQNKKTISVRIFPEERLNEIMTES